jgi:hypothetical protein
MLIAIFSRREKNRWPYLKAHPADPPWCRAKEGTEYNKCQAGHPPFNVARPVVEFTALAGRVPRVGFRKSPWSRVNVGHVYLFVGNCVAPPNSFRWASDSALTQENQTFLAPTELVSVERMMARSLSKKGVRPGSDPLHVVV